MYLVLARCKYAACTCLGLGAEVLVVQPLLTAESVSVSLHPCWGQDLKGYGGFLGGRNAADGRPEVEAGLCGG